MLMYFGHFQIWNIDNDFDKLKVIEAHDNPVCTLASARNMLFSGSLKVILQVMLMFFVQLQIWDIDNDFDKLKVIEAHDNPVCTLALARNMLFSGSLKVI